ncbi:MAG: oligosaccharide flippase family protein [Cyanobacteria bacterium]|nr:oligosaccharide flippase family protein [Cyanobacteriota bacterium]
MNLYTRPEPNSAFVNLVALTSIQVANAGMPLVVFPYVLAVVGSELYAQLVIAESLTQIVNTFVLYSFELDGIAWVVGLRASGDRSGLSTVFSEILATRALSFGLSAIIFAAMLAWIAPELLGVFVPWLLVPLSTVIQPSWLYQGLQRNLPLAILSCSSRVVAVLLVMMAVRSGDDYARVPILIGTTYFATAVLSLVVAMRLFDVSLERVAVRRIRQVLWFGREVFFGNASVLLSRDVNVIILASAAVPGAGIAAYSLADKVLKGLQAAIRPLNQLTLPQALMITKKAHGISRKVFVDLRRLIVPQLVMLGGIFAALALVYAGLRDRIPAVANLPSLDRAETLASIMVWAAFFGVVNFMLGMAGLNNLNERTYYFRSVLGSGLLGAGLCMMTAPIIGEFGGALNVVAFEMVLCALVVRKYLGSSSNVDGRI